MSVFRPSNEWAASMLLSADEINELQLKFVTGEQMPLAINKDMQTLEQQYEQLSLQRMQELQEKEQLADKLNATMQAMPLAVILVDSYGCITDANPEAERLLDEQATFPLIGRFWSAVIRHCFAPQPDDGHEISLRSGKRVSVGTSALKTGGQLVVISDQTETRALQDSLSQHKRLTELGRMTASLAHQIRTPLSAALLYAQNLSHPNLDVHKRDVFNQKLVGQLHALEQQLNDMLIFAKGDVQCNDVLSSEQLIDCVRQHSDAKITQANANLFLLNQCPKTTIRCNKELLMSVIMNVINNAIDAVSSNAQIEVVTQQQAQQMHIDIHDHGPGMSAELIAKVTQPFFTTRSNGTGLGLAVANSVMQAHGGRLNITSTEGEGSCISLVLPMVAGETL